MATYVPAILITAKTMGSGSANIATWQKQNTAGAGTFDIHKTFTAVSPNAGGRVTVEQGSVGSDTVAQKLLDGYLLTTEVEFIQDWWIPVQNNDYFGGFASQSGVVAASYGYTYS